MYAKQIFGDDVRISSSGIYAAKYPVDFESPWTKHVIEFGNLSKASSPRRTQTTQQLLDSADLIVFMQDSVRKRAQKHFTVNLDQTLVWNVRDREDWKDFVSSRPDQRRPSLRYKQKLTWRNIKHQVNVLHALVYEAGWVDVVDMLNRPLGYRLPVAIVNKNKELWHRGCHAIVTTPRGTVLVEKRVSSLFSNAGRLDITMGGIVDAGETPAAAMVRELREELGLKVKQSDCKLLDVYPWQSFHPVANRYTQSFVSTYHVTTDALVPDLRIETGEVAKVYELSKQQVQQLVQTGRLGGYGRLGYAKRYYRWLITKIGMV
jgi:8-oxo-dGTP pyrophosphatase MutT (NUDIX family)/protein-tyrosine-phosphatase